MIINQTNYDLLFAMVNCNLENVIATKAYEAFDEIYTEASSALTDLDIMFITNAWIK